MIIKEAKYKNVMVKQRKCVSETVYGCDECRTEIKEYPNEECRLEMTVFRNNNESAEHLHFCTWDCVLDHLPKVKSDYFVTLPMVYFDATKQSKRGSKQLIKLLTERGQKNKKTLSIKMTTKKAISEIIKQLKTDKNYRRSWSANIAMAYIDNENWYKQRTSKKYLNRKDKHTIANNAAEHFLKLLCDEYKLPNGR